MKISFKKLFKFIISSLAIYGVCFVIFLLANYDKKVTSELLFFNDYEIIPAKKEGDNTVITLMLPQTLQAGDALCFRTSNQEVWLYQSGELKYEHTKKFSNKWGKTATSSWHIVTLNPYNVDPIHLELNTPHESLSAYKNTIAIGNSTKFLEYIFIHTLPSVFITIASIAIGSVCLLWVIFRNNIQFFYRLVLFSLFLIVTGISSLGGSRRIFFELIPPYIDRFIYLLAFYLIPVLLFSLFATFYKGIVKKIFVIYSVVSLFFAGFAVVLQLFEVQDLVQTIYICVIIIVIGVITFFIVTIHSLLSKKNRNSKSLLVVFLSAFIVFGIVNLTNRSIDNLDFYIQCILVLGELYAIAHVITAINYQSNKLVRVQKKLDLAKINVAALKIRPHFMHNTLLSIQELCYSNPIEAVDAIGVFSKYLRSSFEITTTKDTVIPFMQEISHVKEYINVQKICYGDDIVFIENIAYSDFQIPPFTIQPLVENAVKHGIRKRYGVGTITVKVVFDGNIVTILVKDDGVGFDTKVIQYASLKTSTGGVIYRLKNLLNAKVYVESKKNKGTTWIIQFSILEEDRQ